MQTGVNSGLLSSGGGTDAGSNAGSEAIGSTDENHPGTCIDPAEGPEPADVDRIFPIVRAGWEPDILVTGSFVTAARFRVDQSVDQDE